MASTALQEAQHQQEDARAHDHRYLLRAMPVTRCYSMLLGPRDGHQFDPDDQGRGLFGYGDRLVLLPGAGLTSVDLDKHRDFTNGVKEAIAHYGTPKLLHTNQGSEGIFNRSWQY